MAEWGAILVGATPIVLVLLDALYRRGYRRGVESMLPKPKWKPQDEHE